MTILVADDEDSLVMLVRSELELAGYDVITADDGIVAERLVQTRLPDLVMLDIMMPGRDGFAVCRNIRERSNVPIIVLSARHQEQDKVDALNFGADDYMTKPFSIIEMLARINATLRRCQRGETARATLERGALRIEFSARRVTVAGRTVKLTATEYKLLCALARHDGATVAHDAILEAVWGPGYAGQVEYLWVYVGRLRRKLEIDPEQPTMLVSVPGVGYRLEYAPVAGN